jgi:hypothetical protein
MTLNFCEIDIDALIPGKRYMIKEEYYQHTRTIYCIFEGYFSPHITYWTDIRYTIKDCTCQHFTTGRLQLNRLQLNNMTKKAIFYKMISSKPKIQNAMELRALNIVLQNVIGDHTFCN